LNAYIAANVCSTGLMESIMPTRSRLFLRCARVSFPITCLLVGHLSIANAQGTPPATIGGSTTEGQPVRLGEKVINGAPANANNWPGISSLRLYEPDTKKSVHFCGGSAIAKNWVLTAGHCMNDLDVLRRSFFPNDASRNIKLQVVIGSDNLETVAAAAVFDVDEADIRVPDNYKMAVKQARQARDDLGEVYAQGDIALIKLTKAYAGPLSPLASTSEVEAPEAFDELLVAGFGATHPSGRDLKEIRRKDTGDLLMVSSPQLLEAPLALVTQNDCNKAFPGAAIGDKQVCAGAAKTAKPTDSCNGDSGGPLVVITKPNRHIVQIGVVSYGPSPCASQATPMGVYSRVFGYRDWILDVIKSPATRGGSTVFTPAQ